MPNDNAHNYGQFYWCIGLSDEDGTEVYVHADNMTVEEHNGALMAWRSSVVGDRTRVAPVLAFANGEWKFFYAASVMDGHAVAVNHWPGQIAE